MSDNDFKNLTAQARQASLLEYFQQSGYSVKKQGTDYKVEGFSGLFVNPNTNKWFCFGANTGGSSAIDCLTSVLGMDFKQAVRELTGQDIGNSQNSNTGKAVQKFSAPQNFVQAEKKELKMPEEAPNMRRTFAYFCQSRQIPAPIVEELINAKLLYQSQNTVTCEVNGIKQTFENANAVFVHRNANGEAVGAELQGTNSFKRFKGIAQGTTDSVFTYVPNPSKDGKIKVAYLFESAIDLMSFLKFCTREKMVGAALISMAGLKPLVPKQLQEQGVTVLSCVDNDEAGRKFEADNGFTRPDFVKTYLEGNGLKDWNDYLVATNTANKIGATPPSPNANEQEANTVGVRS
jgi:hypothetical protein